MISTFRHDKIYFPSKPFEHNLELFRFQNVIVLQEILFNTFETYIIHMGLSQFGDANHQDIFLQNEL